MNGKEKKLLLDINSEVRSTTQLIREMIYEGNIEQIETYAEALISISHKITNECSNIRKRMTESQKTPTTKEEGK